MVEVVNSTPEPDGSRPDLLPAGAANDADGTEAVAWTFWMRRTRTDHRRRRRPGADQVRAGTAGPKWGFRAPDRAPRVPKGPTRDR